MPRIKHKMKTVTFQREKLTWFSIFKIEFIYFLWFLKKVIKFHFLNKSKIFVTKVLQWIGVLGKIINWDFGPFKSWRKHFLCLLKVDKKNFGPLDGRTSKRPPGPSLALWHDAPTYCGAVLHMAIHQSVMPRRIPRVAWCLKLWACATVRWPLVTAPCAPLLISCPIFAWFDSRSMFHTWLQEF